MKHRILITLTLVAIAAATAWPQASFQAYSDARQVLINGFFDLTFSLENGQGANFKPPTFEDFAVISGPRRAMSTTIINGRVSNETRYTYTLQPQRLGRFIIGPASIEVDGEVLRSNRVTIEVLEPKEEVSSTTDPFYVRAIPENDTAYLGQQVSLDYKLFTAVNIESYNVLEEGDYAGFFAEDLKRFDSRVLREVIGGEQYTTKVLKRVALFPQQAGLLRVEPLRLQLGVVDEDARSRGSFFFNRRIRRLSAATPPVTIQVLPLPGNAPAGFNGAVGDYSLSTRLTTTRLTTDEVVSLRVSITGDGDIKRVLPPDIDFPPTFERYDPKVVEETSFEVNGRITSRKTFEYLAQPSEPGTYNLQPQFVYFSPDSGSYVRLGEEAYTLTVTPGAGRPSANLPETVRPAARDIRFLKPPAPLRQAKPSFFFSPAFWTLSAVPFLLLGGMLLSQRVRQQREGLDPALRRQRRARKEAMRRLKQARHHLEAGESKPFYDEVSKAMLGYVSDKIHIPRSELSKDNVRERLQALRVEEALTDQFIGLLRRCEMALFAGLDQAEHMQKSYEEATGLLTRIEQSLA